MKKILFLILAMHFTHIIAIQYPEVNLSANDKNLQKETQLSQKTLKEIIQFIIKEEQHWHPQWQYQYYILSDLIRKYNVKRGCEIGVAFGGQSLAILTNTNVEKLYCVDPYHHSEAYQSSLNFNQNVFNVIYYLVKKRLEPFGERSQLLRMASVEAAQLAKEEELDFVYIDGNHAYEYVKLDIQSWFDKVRSGGIISGDDWQAEGVRKAVNEFFEGYVIHRKHRIWWIKKK